MFVVSVVVAWVFDCGRWPQKLKQEVIYPPRPIQNGFHHICIFFVFVEFVHQQWTCPNFPLEVLTLLPFAHFNTSTSWSSALTVFTLSLHSRPADKFEIQDFKWEHGANGVEQTPVEHRGLQNTSDLRHRWVLIKPASYVLPGTNVLSVINCLRHRSAQQDSTLPPIIWRSLPTHVWLREL